MSVRPFLPKAAAIAILAALLAGLLTWGPRSKLGRYVLSICVVRVVNESGAPLKDLRFVFTRDSHTSKEYQDIAAIPEGDTGQIWVRATTIHGRAISYDYRGTVVTQETWSSITAGSIIEIHVVPGGWVRVLETH